MLTAVERQREQAVFLAFILDCLLLPLAAWVALQVGSLTLIAEVLRGILLVIIAIFSWLTLRRIHRRRTGGYDFGLGKVEQILSLLVGLLLCVSLGFVWYKAVQHGGTGAHEVTALSFLAVAITFTNLCINAVPLVPLGRALKSGHSVLVLTQFRTKFAKTIGSAVVTVCVAINQLSGNLEVSRMADLAGVTIVTLVTLHAVYELLKSAIPDLLDRTLPESHQFKINEVLIKHFHAFETLMWCHSRQSGSHAEVHVGLGFPRDMSFGRVAEITEAVADDIRAALPGSHVTVTPTLGDKVSPATP